MEHEVGDHGEPGGADQHRRDEHAVAQPFAAEGGKEAWSPAEAQRVHEQDCPQLIDDVGQLEVRVDRADRDATNKTAATPRLVPLILMRPSG